MNSPTLNLAIMAHVDAGKTTISEQMLFAAGVIRQAGSVDRGDTATDNLEVERERGISVRLATDSLQWNNVTINLIDTPGHVDFSSEVERALLALDGAVLVISAVEGVQGHTVNLFRALEALKIPTLFFINKIDRVGADADRVLNEIDMELTSKGITLQSVKNQGSTSAKPAVTWCNREYALQESAMLVENISERIAELDDQLLEKYLDGKVLNFSELDQQLRKSASQLDAFPILFGVAKNGTGIEELLDSVIRYLMNEEQAQISTANESLSAVVFKIEHDCNFGKMAHLRVFSGNILPRDLITNTTRASQDKVAQLKRITRGKYIDINGLAGGDIGIISGLTSARIGDIYGQAMPAQSAFNLGVPLLTVQVKSTNKDELPQLVGALKQLSAEDPSLSLQWLPVLKELHINITGRIQLEILKSILQSRFSLLVDFTSPSVIYKETPAKSGYGYERYWMPKPCWAILKLKIEPGERGSGIVYNSEVSVNDIAAKYQNEIEATINQSLSQGIKGWQVTDIKITLVEGEDHNVHTRPGDYTIATPMAIMNGLLETETCLLEPILDFNIFAPIDLLGTITSDITKMRGTFHSPDINGEQFCLIGKVPASTSLEYGIQLASISGGKAKLSTQLSCYEACSTEQGEVTDYRGISPLERDKWILQARGAIKT